MIASLPLLARRYLASPHAVLGTQHSVPSDLPCCPPAASPLLPLLLLASVLTLSFVSIAHSQEKNTRLPWEAPPRANDPILRPPTGPGEVLERFGIGPSQLDGFVSGQPLSPTAEDVLVKILYRFPRLGLENLLRWRQRGVGWEQLAAAPADHRAQVFRLAGRVKRVEKQSLLPEQVELYEFDHYFRVKLALGDSPYEAWVAARRVPATWAIAAPLDERAEADAIFLKVGDTMAEPPQLVFAADRIGWFPDRVDPPNHIGRGQLALARLGMDISLWDDIRESKDQSLTTADREGFYQLLAALGRPESARLRESRKEALDLVPLLENQADHFGDVLPVEGIARRVMKVPVSDADVRSRFGLDHYYEIDLFLPLGNAGLRFAKGPSGEENPVYRNAFPATLIVRELPPGLKEGENVHEQVRADGVFFKVWTYRSNYTSRFGQLQPAPLFIASQARLVSITPTANWVTGALVMAAFALALGVTGIIVLWYGRSDRAAAAKSVLRTKTDARPDFSHLS